MAENTVMKVTTKVLEVIQQHRNDVVYTTTPDSISPTDILYTFGATDELRGIISDLQEALGIEFESDEIGELTVKTFINLVIDKTVEKQLASKAKEDEQKEVKCICYDCKLDKIPSGCNKSINDMKVMKGIGTVECLHFSPMHV